MRAENEYFSVERLFVGGADHGHEDEEAGVVFLEHEGEFFHRSLLLKLPKQRSHTHSSTPNTYLPLCHLPYFMVHGEDGVQSEG